MHMDNTGARKSGFILRIMYGVGQIKENCPNKEVSVLQCNKLNQGQPTLISQSQVMFTTKESGFGSL